MRVLLDIHAFSWFVSGDRRLSSNVRAIIEDSSNERFVSAATCWEITIKASRGRLELKLPLERLFSEAIEGNNMRLLRIERMHLIQLSNLPMAHGDPFDRLLVSQAIIEGLTRLSNDQTLDAYQVPRIW